MIPKSEVRSLKYEIIAAIVAHAREVAPEECCGVLLGHGEAIVDARRARNVATSTETRFLIDPKDHIDARRDGRARGLDVVGFYHSHPRSGAVPSPTDVAEAAYPGALHVIIGLGADPPEVRAFEFDEGNFRERPLVTVA